MVRASGIKPLWRQSAHTAPAPTGKGWRRGVQHAIGTVTLAGRAACERAIRQYIAKASNPRSGIQVLKKFDVEPQSYRDAMSRFAGAVHVITTDGPAGLRGATVIAACSVSDHPPMVLACLNRENPKNDAFVENGNFALNTLAEHQQPLAIAFSGLTRLAVEERFALASWDKIASGAPALLDALAVFDCELVDTKDLATHRVLFGRVTGLRLGDRVKPLIYHDRGYKSL
jgi:cob(II)yrinic acid a,c-diamide reductase